MGRLHWIAGMVLPLAVSGAPAAAADLVFQAEAQALTGDCTGGAVRLEGNHDTATLTGTCRSLLVKGVDDVIRLNLAPGGSIRVEGSGNRVSYAAPAPGPAIETLGPDNAVTAIPAPIPAPVPARPIAVPRTALPVALALAGDDQERLADCAGRDASITGSRSAYVVRGACRSLTVRGDLLTIQVEMRPGARISVAGRGDVVTWAMAKAGRDAGPLPVAVVHGAGSRVQRALPPGQ